MMQPPSKELKATDPEMTQAQASAPPRGPEMRIASWNLGVPHANSNVGLPHANSNMGPLTIPKHMHYQTELCLSGIAGHWAKVAAEILEWDYVNDKLALCWDPHVWELLEHKGTHLFPEEERNVKTKKGRKVQVASAPPRGE